MISDDLSSLFGPARPGPALAASYRQGVIVSFNTVDGTNTVSVSGTVLANVPMLLTGAEVQYSAGDRVVLMVLGNTYLMIGKVAVPGSATYASATVSQSSVRNVVSNYAVAATPTIINTVTQTVPPWANHALFMGSFWGSAANTGAGDQDLEIAMALNGDIGATLWSFCRAGFPNGGTVGHFVNMAVTPGSTVTHTGSLWCTAAMTASVFNNCELNVAAIFSKQ